MNYYMKNIEFQEIETKRLILKEISHTHKNDMFEIFSKSEVVKFYGMHPMKSLEEAENLINKFNEGFKSNSGIRWGITLKDNNKLIGTCGFHNWNKNYYRAEMGYDLSSTYWKMGYMQEAIKAILSYGFDTMNLNRIEALIYPDNTPSRMVLEKCGFQEEGLLKEYAYFLDSFQDLIMFSLLKRNWNKLNK